MKTIRNNGIWAIAFALFFLAGCLANKERNLDFLNAVDSSPAKVSLTALIVPDNSGTVTLYPTGENSVYYNVYLPGSTTPVKLNAGENVKKVFTEGTYSIRVVAYSATGKTTEVTVSVTVTFRPPENLEVTADIDAANNFKVNVTAKALYETNFTVTYGDATNETPVTFLEGQTVSHTYAATGTYTITVKAISGSASSQATKTVTIVNPVLLPLTFESASTQYNWTNFDGGEVTVIANAHSTGINTSTKVAQMVKKAGQTWGGSFLPLSSPIDFSSKKYITMKVYSPRAGAKVLLKVENISDGSINFEKEVLTTKANDWENMVFDYTAIDATKSYQKIVLIFDNGTAGDGSANFTFLFDDVTQVATPPATAIALPLTFESLTSSIFTDFDGGVGTVITNPQSNGINTSAKVAQMVKNVGQTWGGSYITLDNAIDFSTKKYFTMSVYSPRVGAKVLLKVENLTDGGISFQKEVATTKANQWESLVFDYTTIDATKSYQKVVLIFDNGTAGDGSANYTFLFDDITQVVSAPSVTPTIALPLTFESLTSSIFTNFNGGTSTIITNPQSSGINTSAKVAQMVKNAGQTWGGSYITLDNPIDFSTKKYFTMSVYSPRVGAKVLLKVENLTDGGISLEKEVATTKANQWESLTFDYTTINTANSYQKVILIFDNGTAGDGSANFTFLFDDITQVATAPTVSVTPITLIDFETAITVTDFNGGNLTRVANPQSSGINTSAMVGKMIKNAGEVWGGSYVTLASAIDFSARKHVTMKVYSPRVGAKVLLKVENLTDGGISLEKEVATTKANEWETLTFDYTTIDATKSYQKVVLIFDNGTAGDGSANFTFLVDDITLIQ